MTSIILRRRRRRVNTAPERSPEGGRIRRPAVVRTRELVGGECSYWACPIPFKKTAGCFRPGEAVHGAA